MDHQFISCGFWESNSSFWINHSSRIFIVII